MCDHEMNVVCESTVPNKMPCSCRRTQAGHQWIGDYRLEAPPPEEAPPPPEEVPPELAPPLLVPDPPALPLLAPLLLVPELLGRVPAPPVAVPDPLAGAAPFVLVPLALGMGLVGVELGLFVPCAVPVVP